MPVPAPPTDAWHPLSQGWRGSARPALGVRLPEPFAGGRPSPGGPTAPAPWQDEGCARPAALCAHPRGCVPAGWVSSLHLAARPPPALPSAPSALGSATLCSKTPLWPRRPRPAWLTCPESRAASGPHLWSRRPSGTIQSPLTMMKLHFAVTSSTLPLEHQPRMAAPWHRCECSGLRVRSSGAGSLAPASSRLGPVP